MKKVFKITAVTAMSMMIFTSGVVFASPVKTKIKAILNKGTTFTLNGSRVSLEDNNGNKVYPIQYNKQYYVPINSICNLLKTPVVADSTKNNIAIGVREDKSLIDKEFNMTVGNIAFSTLQRTTDKNHLTFGDVVFKTGLLYNIHSYVSDKDLTVAINSKYSKLSFSVIADNDTPQTLSVVNGDTNVEIASMQISKNGVSTLTDVPIGGIKNLVFRPQQSDDSLKLVIGDPIVK